MSRRWATGAALAGALVLAAAPSRAECVETAATGSDRPTMTETFPLRGTSGYAATLRVVVSHGKGETVLPRGIELQSESDAARTLKSAGFALPDQDGGAPARVVSAEGVGDGGATAGRRQTILELPLVPLPEEPGRRTLVLPALPVAVARASGDVVTLCTAAHSIVVDDPTASTPHATPKPNPPPRRQREEWVSLERALLWILLGGLIGSICRVGGHPLGAPAQASPAAAASSRAVGGGARAPR